MVSIFKMNKTKHKIQFPASFIAAFSFFFILTCSEDPGHGPHGSDGIPPGKVTINQVVNTPGGAVIYFHLLQTRIYFMYALHLKMKMKYLEKL